MYKKLFNIIFKTQLKQHANDTHFSELTGDIFLQDLHPDGKFKICSAVWNIMCSGRAYELIHFGVNALEHS